MRCTRFPIRFTASYVSIRIVTVQNRSRERETQHKIICVSNRQFRIGASETINTSSQMFDSMGLTDVKREHSQPPGKKNEKSIQSLDERMR